MGGSATNVTNEECEEGQLGSWAVGQLGKCREWVWVVGEKWFRTRSYSCGFVSFVTASSSTLPLKTC